ncbi:Retrovirus-related Pol polyprotein from type-1 retrotransposable element R2, partial [Araneus ventricosus]
QTIISESLPSDLNDGMIDHVELSTNPQFDGLQNVQIVNTSGTISITPAAPPNQDVSLSMFHCLLSLHRKILLSEKSPGNVLSKDAQLSKQARRHYRFIGFASTKFHSRNVIHKLILNLRKTFIQPLLHLLQIHCKLFLSPPVETESCPSHPLRSGDTLHLLFPIFNPTDCTEKNCVFKSRGKTWYSIKCSLLRHLQTAHHLSNLITVHWCATCASRIKQPKKHQCLAPGVMANIKIDGAFPCTENGCTDEFPSELGLRNHLSAHKKATALANATQRVIPKMGPKKFKRKKKGDLPVTDIPDESITDPVFALAPPPPPEVDNPPYEETQEDVPVPGPLSIYIEHIEDIINQDPTEEFFEYFCQAIEMAVAEVQNISFQPPPSQPADQNVKRSRKDIDITDPQACQTLFNRNPKRAVREICEGPPIRCQIPANVIEDHFKSAWDAQHPVLTPLPPTSEERTPILERNFSINEVSKKLASAQNSAPGPDRLTYFHWRSVPKSQKFLTLAFNASLHFQRIPPSWKRTVNILIPKKSSDLDNPANWRPIALSNTIYKIFTKVLAGRLSDWCSKFSALSHCQKGFTPFDGVLEHDFVLQTRLEHARAQNKDLCVAWLDVTNAFGADPHQLIYNALSAAGSGEQFINIIKDIYTDCHTSILSNDSSTNPIKINSGVKQGCPISGLLFNISIDHILRKIQGNASEHQILAFADDLCLLGSSADELQDMLDVVQSEMTNIGLALNPTKSFSFHFSGSTPVRVEHSTFRLGSDLLTPIEEFNFTKFLGKPVGFNPVPDYDTFNNFGITAKKLLASQLSAWQKIQALKMFFFPALQFVIRTGQFKKEDWTLLDDAVRHAVKEVLFLPENASNEYIYGHVRSGCVGLPIAAEESDLNRIDSAFKLLTSKDSLLSDLALKHLTNSVSSRMQKVNITDEDLANFMSGDLDIDENDRPHSNPYSNVWTVARVASRRLKAEWLFNEGIPQIKFKDIIIKSSARRKVLFSIRNRLRQDRALALTSKPDQGRIMECIAQSPTSSHFLLNGQYLRFSEYRFIHRARLNLLPLNGLPWKETTDKKCRRCSKADLETLAHVLNHCEPHSRAWQLRHNGIQDRIVVAARNSSVEILSVNKKVTKELNLRPDIVLKLNGKIFIVDVTCPFENRLESIERAKQEKHRKYAPLLDHFLPSSSSVEIVPIVVGALGYWDPANDRFLSKIMSKSYLKKMAKLCVSDNARWARDIYVEHITGHRQFNESLVVNNPDYRPQEIPPQDDPLAAPVITPLSGYDFCTSCRAFCHSWTITINFHGVWWCCVIPVYSIVHFYFCFLCNCFSFYVKCLFYILTPFSFSLT